MSFDLQPALQGKHVTLRPLQSGDFRELYAVAADPFIWEQHPVSDRWKEDVFKALGLVKKLQVNPQAG